MVSKYLAIAFLITGFLVGDAYGEEDEVFYCAETDSNGFGWDNESKRYNRTYFVTEKFKLKINRVSNTIAIAWEDGITDYTCDASDPLDERLNLMKCNRSFNHFSFNTSTGHFVHSRMIGYIVGEDNEVSMRDSLQISYGTCDKF